MSAPWDPRAAKTLDSGERRAGDVTVSGCPSTSRVLLSKNSGDSAVLFDKSTLLVASDNGIAPAEQQPARTQPARTQPASAQPGQDIEQPAPWRLVDMHCHLDRMSNALEVAGGAQERSIAILCTTVTPEDAITAQIRFANSPNVRVAAGLHPWWVTRDTEQGNHDAHATQLASHAAELAAASSYVGEIGLDFSPAHAHTATAQRAAFERIVSACAASPRAGRVVSIHAVRAATEVLDILERHGLNSSATCIFHRFSGTSDELARLRELGFHISVHERMLATKRGREYVRQMPLQRLHLETDAPSQFDTPYSVDKLEASLMSTLATIAQLRGIAQEELAAHMTQVGSRLFGV